MRAAILRDRKIVAEDLPDPEPASGQVLVKTLACGICGSDLHAAKHLDQLAEAMLLPVPDGFPTEYAALTEPMAVGIHAVAKARMEKGDVPLITGRVGVDGVSGAFETLANSEEHAKILVEPWK